MKKFSMEEGMLGSEKMGVYLIPNNHPTRIRTGRGCLHHVLLFPVRDDTWHVLFPDSKLAS